MWLTVTIHGFLEEYQGCFAIASLRNKGLKNFTFVVNWPPEIIRFPIDFDEDLVKMPFPI